MSSNTMFTCDCGSVLKKTSLYKHNKSKKHLFHIQHQDNPECVICYEEKLTSQSFQCGTCQNRHCKLCHSKIDKCPFCRTIFPRSRNTDFPTDTRTSSALRTIRWRQMAGRLDTLMFFAERGMLTFIPGFRDEIQYFDGLYPYFADYFRQDQETFRKLNYLVNLVIHTSF